MEKAYKFLPFILGGIVAIVVFFVSKKIRKGNETSTERAAILEKAREAKYAKSILRKSDDEESIANIG
jgi:uncharacterized membrane protein YgaE (UPF0421/DUF939 family)